jgi:O-antigen/teichoic acid export membrane protein
MGFILLKEVARSRETLRTYWCAAFTVTILSGSILLGLVLALSRLIWGSSVPFELVVLVGIADIIVVRIVDLVGQAFAAIELLQKTAEVNVVLSIARAASAACLIFAWRTPNLLAWGWLYLFGAIFASVYSVLAMARIVGLPILSLRAFRGQLKEGFYFAVSQASLTLHNDVDKTMLVRFAGLEATGIYGAAYRIVDVSFAPVAALVYATLARFFRHGQAGISEAVRFGKKLTAYSTIYGTGALLILVLCAPILPRILGHDFGKSVAALRWLSPIIVIRAIHYFLANSLSGAGYQGSRSLAQVAIVAVNILLNIWLLPRYSWRGAAWASLASDGALVLALLLVINFWERRSRESEDVPALHSGALL